MYQRAEQAELAAKLDERAARTAASAAYLEAVLGNLREAKEGARSSLAPDRSRDTLRFAGMALATAGELQEASKIADELARRFPNDTYGNTISIPLIRAGVELGRGNAAKAIELLEPARRYDLGWIASSFPPYLRGKAHLKLGQGKEAAAEFQKMLDHSGSCLTFPHCSLARLQLGRARALLRDDPGARTAYQDFFALWKDADPEIPVLTQAKSEYGKLQ